uniref:Uncharacterized protein n=1 Tax=Anguilla anguilla TaxID=7936 RepID=A0A0E9PXZ6_ANGAN
MNQWQTEKI